MSWWPSSFRELVDNEIKDKASTDLQDIQDLIGKKYTDEKRQEMYAGIADDLDWILEKDHKTPEELTAIKNILVLAKKWIKSEKQKKHWAAVKALKKLVKQIEKYVTVDELDETIQHIGDALANPDVDIDDPNATIDARKKAAEFTKEALKVQASVQKSKELAPNALSAQQVEQELLYTMDGFWNFENPDVASNARLTTLIWLVFEDAKYKGVHEWLIKNFADGKFTKRITAIVKMHHFKFQHLAWKENQSKSLDKQNSNLKKKLLWNDLTDATIAISDTTKTFVVDVPGHWLWNFGFAESDWFDTDTLLSTEQQDLQKKEPTFAEWEKYKEFLEKEGKVVLNDILAGKWKGKMRLFGMEIGKVLTSLLALFPNSEWMKNAVSAMWMLMGTEQAQEITTIIKMAELQKLFKNTKDTDGMPLYSDGVGQVDTIRQGSGFAQYAYVSLPLKTQKEFAQYPTKFDTFVDEIAIVEKQPGADAQKFAISYAKWIKYEPALKPDVTQTPTTNPAITGWDEDADDIDEPTSLASNYESKGKALLIIGQETTIPTLADTGDAQLAGSVTLEHLTSNDDQQYAIIDGNYVPFVTETVGGVETTYASYHRVSPTSKQMSTYRLVLDGTDLDVQQEKWTQSMTFPEQDLSSKPFDVQRAFLTDQLIYNIQWVAQSAWLPDGTVMMDYLMPVLQDNNLLAALYSASSQSVLSSVLWNIKTAVDAKKWSSSGDDKKARTAISDYYAKLVL